MNCGEMYSLRKKGEDQPRRLWETKAAGLTLGLHPALPLCATVIGT